MTYRSARLHRLAESIPWNRFLGFLNVHKYGLRALPADAVVTNGAVLTKTTSFVRIGFFNSIHNPQSKGDGEKVENLISQRKILYKSTIRFDGKPVCDM
jgi:hypothetical protein